MPSVDSSDTTETQVVSEDDISQGTFMCRILERRTSIRREDTRRAPDRQPALNSTALASKYSSKPTNTNRLVS